MEEQQLQSLFVAPSDWPMTALSSTLLRLWNLRGVIAIGVKLHEQGIER